MKRQNSTIRNKLQSRRSGILLSAQSFTPSLAMKQKQTDKKLAKVSAETTPDASKIENNTKGSNANKKALQLQELVKKLKETNEEDKYESESALNSNLEQSTPDSNIEHDKIIENGDEVEEIEDQQINEEQSESDSDDELNAKLIQSKVAMGDDFDLSKVFDHEDSPIAYQPGGNQIKFIIMLLFFSIYLIVNSMSTIRTSDGHQLSSSIRSTFENLPIDTTSLRYTDIIDKKYVRLFFTNILIPQIYEELGKEYPAMVDGYHYINNYNYFAGMRLTHNRVILDYKKHNGFYDDVRKRNYVGRTNIKFKNIHTDVFDLYETEYSGSGGYADKGGYIYFLKDNLTYDEAIQFADDAYNNYMFDDEYLTLTFELMFYNQNLQTGCIVSYEFLNNNAAMVEKHVIVSTFFVSRYSEHNKILSPSTRLFMII